MQTDHPLPDGRGSDLQPAPARLPPARYFQSGLRTETCGLGLGKSRVVHRKSFETFLGRPQGRACPLDIDLVSELGAVGQDGHNVVYNFSKATTHHQSAHLSPSPVCEATRLERGKKCDVVRQHAELTDCARGGHFVRLLIEEQTLGSNYTET